MPWVAAVIAAGAAVGNMLSNASAAQRAEMIQDKALRELVKNQIPDPRMQALALEKYAQTGELTPELQQAIKAAPSEFEKIVTDTSHRSAQNRALGELEKIGYDGGLRLQDKAALQQTQMQAAVRDRGQRLSIQDEMERRGSGGSGMALQAKLQGQQAAGDRASRDSLSIAAQAQDRALQSIMGAGDMATKYRSQDFEEQSAKAKAADAIAMFNTRNLQDVNNANVGIRNNAQAANLGERQRIADANVKQDNYQQQYNKELMQKKFENELSMSAAKNGIYNQQSQGAIKQGEQQGNFYTNMGQAGTGAYSSYQAGEDRRQADQRASEERQKERDFLGSLYGSKS